MNARYASRCPACHQLIHPGQQIELDGSKWVHIGCIQDRTVEPDDRFSRFEISQMRQGMSEVAQIQACAPAGSALREAMYFDMELAAFNRGEDY